MNKNDHIVLYGSYYKNGKLYFENIKSDFDIIRELNKLHKKTINGNVKCSLLTLMCSYFHGQPYK